MARGSITLWRRIAQVAAVVLTLIVVVPYLLPRSLHAADHAKYSQLELFSPLVTH